ncbi:MAG: alkane 1-monooxygenase [Pseudoruegeria sp.]
MPPRQMFFTFATGLPVGLLFTASLIGGCWIWIALAYLTVFAALLDVLMAKSVVSNAADKEFPASDFLLAGLGIAHFALLATVINRLSDGTTHSVIEGVGLWFAHVLFLGQISNANAHELIHRPQRALFQLGKWTYISLLFGHHTSAHRLVHHKWVGSRQDPNTPRLGDSFYRFAYRAWIGSFRKGLEQENQLRRRASHQPSVFTHPYLHYSLGGLLFCAIACFIGGLTGLLIYVPMVFWAQMQLLQTDYVQHYGLQRKTDNAGKLEHVQPQHSWNSPHWFSGVLILHAPRHSDHHMHPSTPYPNLKLSQEMPMLPYSMPFMAVIALFPIKFQSLMDPLVQKWRAPSD